MTWTDNMTSWKRVSLARPVVRTVSLAYDVVDVETRVTVVESQEPVERQLGSEVVVFSRQHLFTHTGTDLCLEIENGSETEISTFTTLVVLGVLDSSTSAEGHHTSKDILVQVQTLLSLGHTASGVHVDGVQEIGLNVLAGPPSDCGDERAHVTVMKLSADVRQ